MATALHCGHALRGEVAELMALDEADRLREEDPYTERLAEMVETRIIPHRSRFEVDLNRPRHEAVYRVPEQAWGLPIWREPLPQAVIERSLKDYDAFYAALRTLLQELEQRYGRFVVFDLHAYNHRRGGPDAPPADPEENPDVNIGTGTMERTRWAPVVDRFLHDLRACEVGGRALDVRENVKFVGRGFAAWVHGNFPRSACVLAIELKKFFMDEWSGRLDAGQFEAIAAALRSTLPGLRKTLESL